MLAPIPTLTKAEIELLYRWRCSHGHRGITHYNCWLKESGVGIKTGFLDIECTNLKANFGCMISYCIKPEGSNKMLWGCLTREDLEGDLDKRILQQCIDDMWKFNRLAGHYSSRFDFPFLRTRALIHGLEFPGHGEIVQTDVWRLARNSLCLHSNKQAVVAETLLGRTQKTRLDANHWACALMSNDKGDAARKYILDHNRKDVKDLEKNYQKLVGFSPKSNRSI